MLGTKSKTAILALHSLEHVQGLQQQIFSPCPCWAPLFVAGGLSGGLWLTASPWLLVTLPLRTLWGALLPVLLVSVVDITAASTRKFASAYHDVVTLEAVCCSNPMPLPSQTTLLADHTIWQRKCLCMQESLLLSLYSQLQLLWTLSSPHWKNWGIEAILGMFHGGTSSLPNHISQSQL